MSVVISVVATVYNDSELVKPLCEALLKELRGLGVSYEIILVDDGSSDRSAREIEAACAAHSEIRAVLLARNYGQQVAVSAGARFAQGQFVLLMDGDLQNPVEAIGQLYEMAKNGDYDIVYTSSKKRDSVINAIASRFFSLLLMKVFNLKIVPNQLMMRLMSRRFADHFNSYVETKRTVFGITADIGLRSTVLQVEQKPRAAGRSKYNPLSRFNLFLDVILSMTTYPLNFLIYAGALVLFVALGYGALIVYRFFIYDVPPGYTSIVLSILLLGSLNLIGLGFVARYLSFIYLEVRERPLFLVERTIGIAASQTTRG